MNPLRHAWHPLLALVALPSAPAPAQTTLHASLSTASVDADKNCDLPAISGDGRWVVFETTSTLLDPADGNGVRDVFLRDTVAGTTQLASLSWSGIPGVAASSNPSVASAGPRVAFESDSANLVPGDSNGRADVFVRDAGAGTTIRVSVSSAGVAGNGNSGRGRITDGGAFVAFDSLASNLVSGDGNGARDAFVHDLAAATTERVSVSSSGAEGNGVSEKGVASADGNLVVFESRATNLVAGDTNGYIDVYLRDRAAGTTRRMSLAWDGSQPTNDCVDPVISGDGRFVAFSSHAGNLARFDTNGTHDVFVVEVATGAIERASLATGGFEADSESFLPSLSHDGRWVGFVTRSANLAAGDWNGQKDLFVRDRLLGITTWLSVGDAGQTGSNVCEVGAICGDGSRAVFGSRNEAFAPTDLDKSLYDVFVRVRDLTPASWSEYGEGVAGTLGVPSIALSAPPRVGSTVDLVVGSSAPWYAVGLLLAGTEPADDPLWGGELLLVPAFSIAVALLPGTTALPIEVPPDELLAGETWYAQVLLLDAAAPHGVAFTPGLAAVAGY